MHIAIDARIINSSTGRYVERLLTHLEQIDHEHTYSVLVPTKDKDFWQPTNPNFTIRTIDYPNYSFAEQVGFKQYLDQLAPDLVHFCMPQQPVLYTGKVVTTFHDLTLLNTYNSDKNWLVFHAKQWVGKFVFRRVARRSRAIITPTEYTKRELVDFSGVSPSKITVTYEAPGITPGTKLVPFSLPFKKFLLYVGQQPDYKNIRRLAAAHQVLLQKFPDLGLVLAGRLQPDVRANRAYFEAQGYRNIVFTDYIPDTQRDWLYRNCEVYVFPSLMEGFGLPGLEAMASGAPVASSDATCLPEVYGNAAEYFDPHHTDSIAHAIEHILLDGKLRTELVKKGAHKASEYSWKRMAEQTLDVYRRVLQS